MTTAKQVVAELKKRSIPKNKEGMAAFGINTNKALGVPVPAIREIAKKLGKNHLLASELWETELHEARMLACFIDVPAAVTEEQLESWVKEFDSWDVCDQCCSNLFDKTPYAYSKAIEWTKRREEFVKRAGFVLMACLAVHDKKAGDEKFLDFLPAIKREASDERNFVKKAVNWALRQIGKRNKRLNEAAVKTAKEIKALPFKSAKWIAADALRELEGKTVLARLVSRQ